MGVEVTRRAEGAAATGPAAARGSTRSAIVPREHGGWGLTLEPVLLGLLLVPSLGGTALGLAAVVAFLARTPLNRVLVDASRRRWLPRSTVAARVLLVELAVLGALLAVAVRWSGWSWWPFVAVAAPLVVVELAYDMRSRSRRLVPELSGSVAVTAVVGALVLAGGGTTTLAAAATLVLAARAVASVTFVRTQILRVRRGATDLGPAEIAQVMAIAIVAVAVTIDRQVFAGLAAVVAVAVLQARWLRRPTVAARTLGLRQLALGLGIVALTAAGVHLV